MINKIFLLLPIISLSSCITVKSENIRENEKKCEYYKTVPNYYNSKLKNIYDKEKSAVFILNNNNVSCMSSDCYIFAVRKKWDFIEIELNGNVKKPDQFPKNGDSGTYKIVKNYHLYNIFLGEEKISNHINSINRLCISDINCITCDFDNYCLTGKKIKKTESKITIKENILQFETYSVLNYEIKINNELFVDYKDFIYSTKNKYTTYGFGSCRNYKGLEGIQKDIFGGFDE